MIQRMGVFKLIRSDISIANNIAKFHITRSVFLYLLVIKRSFSNLIKVDPNNFLKQQFHCLPISSKNRSCSLLHPMLCAAFYQLITLISNNFLYCVEERKFACYGPLSYIFRLSFIKLHWVSWHIVTFSKQYIFALGTYSYVHGLSNT